MALTARRQRSPPDIWPGFVDALATMLIIIIFLLMVFTLAQYFLSELLSGRNEALDRLNRQVSELAELLAIEQDTNTDLRRNLGQISAELQFSITAREQISARLAKLIPERDALEMALAERAAEGDRLQARLAVLEPERDALMAALAQRAAERDRLQARLAVLEPERVALTATLAQRAAEGDRLQSRLDARDREHRTLTADMAALRVVRDTVDRELVDANTVIAADREKIELQLRTIASLKRDIIALQTVRNELESKVGALADTLKERDQALTESDQSLRERGLVLKERDEALKKQDLALKKQDQSLTATRDRNNELEARLSTEAERTRLAQKDISEKDVNLRNLMRRAVEGAVALTKEQKLSAEARRQLGLLNRQIAALRQQLARIAVALEASEAKAKAQNVQIVNLGKRLNAALVSKVAELARYRSEFFGKLRQALGNQAGIRIVGDRFVFQSEVLFESGSATLVGTAGRQIRRIAEILKQVAARIPADVDWVLRVDGHTDRNPIKTPQFPSNWELSTGRAISVVKQLIALGIPPERLAPTGFGEHRPLDTGDTIQAHSRNRRIEFKLTGR